VDSRAQLIALAVGGQQRLLLHHNGALLQARQWLKGHEHAEPPHRRQSPKLTVVLPVLWLVKASAGRTQTRS
jgi:hypothetical protein